MKRLFSIVMSFALFLVISSSQAQNRFYHVYLDTDNNTTTGCDIDLTDFSTVINGIDSRITITTDNNLPPNITDNSIQTCLNGAFGSGQAINAAAIGLNTGENNNDILELSVNRSDLAHANQRSIRAYYATQSDAASDIVLSNSNGGPILLGFPFAIPTLSIFGLLLFVLLISLIAKNQLSKKISVSIVLIGIMTTAIAMVLVVDGQTNDWVGLSPANSDPVGDTSGPGSYADLTSVFLAFEDEIIFVRMDVVDLENQAPIANNTSVSTNEETAVTITLTGTDAEGSALSFLADTQPNSGTLSAFTVINDTTSTVQYTPNLDFNGSDQFAVFANDGQVNSAPAIIDITINAINDAPSFNSGGNINILKTDGPYMETWATNISSGPTDEATQNLTFNLVSNDNAALFTVQPSLDSSGNLSFTAVTDASGTANITVNLSDDGGTANGGIDTSADVSFSIAIQSVNDEPSFTVGTNQTVLEDSAASIVAAWATNISAGPPDESGQALTFNITANDNPTLFSAGPSIAADGTLSYTPAADANGTANITVELMDDGGTANGGDDTSPAQNFSITVTAVNDEPSFTSGGNINILKTDGPYMETWATNISSGPTDEATQNLTFNLVSNDNAALFSVQPSLDSSGNLSFTAVTDASGTANITVNLSDDGGTANGGIDTSADVSFSIAIQSVNDEPSFTVGTNQTVLEDSAASIVAAWATNISAGPPDESGQALTFNITANDNPTLFSAGPSIAADGTLSYTPAADANGTANITVELMDDGGTANGGDDTSPAQNFSITVTAVNDVPSFTSGGNVMIDENSGPINIAWASNLSSGPVDENSQTLSFNTINVSNNTLFTVEPTVNAVTGNLNFTTALNAVGTSTITVNLMDNGLTANGGIDTSANVVFDVIVIDANTPPILITIGDQNIDEETLLSFNAVATDSDVPAQTLSYSLSGAVPTGATITPLGAFSWTPTETQGPGSYNFDVIVTDNGTNPANLIDFENITIDVNEVNAPPVADSQTVTTDDATPLNIILTGSDSESSPLTFAIVTPPSSGSLSSINQLTPTSAEVTYTPGVVGNNDFSFNVNDGILNSPAATVTLDVTSSNLPPVANNDSYTVTGNVGLDVPFGSGVTVNDTDPDMDVLSVTAFDAASIQGGTVNVNANGSFTYNPPVGYTGADSFGYTMSDGLETDTATVSLTVSDKIWFIDNSAVGAGNGTLATPFNTLAGFDSVNGNAGATNPQATECVFINETSNGDYVGPVTLLTNQIIIGKGTTVPIASSCGVTLAPNSTPLPTINGTSPLITSSSNGINLATGNTLRGFDIGNTTDTDINAVNNVGNLTIREMSLLGNGRALNLANGGNLDVILDQIVSTSSSNNGVYLAEVGGNFTVSNGTTINSSATNGLYILNLDAGSVYDFGDTNVTNSGANGIQIYGDPTSNVTFNQLNISNPNNFAYFQFGGGLNTTSGTLNAPNSTAFSLENAVANVTLTSVSGNNNNGSGVKLDNNTGTINLGTGLISSSVSGTVFDVGSATNASGGSAIITYNGDIFSSGSGRSVMIEELAGGSITLNGNITENSNGISIQGINNGIATVVTFGGNITANTSTSSAIDLGSVTGNSNATINFTGALDINTTSGRGFNALNGGTLNATGANSTIVTTTGIALNIQNTNIGASNLIFQSISAGTGAGSPGVGINLNTTGISGGLIITGIGSTAGSGGTIRNKTGADGSATAGIGINLADTNAVQLSNMQLNDFDNFAIKGLNVNGLTLIDSTINGINGNNNAFNEGAVNFFNSSGIISLLGNAISGGIEDQVNIINNTGSVTVNITDSTNDAAIMGLDAVPASLNGNDAVFIESQMSATANITIDGVSFTGARGDLVQINALDNATQTILIQNNDMNNTHPNSLGGGVTVAGGGAGASLNIGYDVLNNTLLNSVSNAITVNYISGAGTVSGSVSGNMIGNNALVDSGSLQGAGILVGAAQNIQHNTTIVNNTITQAGGTLGALEVVANVENVFNAIIDNNSVIVSSNPMGFGLSAFYSMLGGGTGAESGTACIHMTNNFFNASLAPFAGNAIYIDQISAAANYNFPAYPGSQNGEGFAGTASIDLHTHFDGLGNTFASGPFPIYVGTSTDATLIQGATNTGTTCN